jgi:hypothetical protein
MDLKSSSTEGIVVSNLVLTFDFENFNSSHHTNSNSGDKHGSDVIYYRLHSSS